LLGDGDETEADEAAKGMEEMSEKFNEGGGELYVKAD
jgi:hypothetical protein